MSGQTLQTIAYLSNGQTVHGTKKDVSNLTEDKLSESLENLAALVKNFKEMTYLSLNIDDEGTICLNPDHILAIQIKGSTKQLNDLVQRYL